MNVQIVPCSIADVEALRRIALETYAQTFGSMNTEDTMRKYLDEAFSQAKLLEELLNARSFFYFLRTDDMLSGYLKLNEAPAQSDLNDPQSLEIERIYVKRELQGQGLGKALIRYSLSIARQRAKSYIWLGVWERNISAIAFYKKMGFSVEGNHPFRMGEEIQNDLVMKKAVRE